MTCLLDLGNESGRRPALSRNCKAAAGYLLLELVRGAPAPDQAKNPGECTAHRLLPSQTVSSCLQAVIPSRKGSIFELEECSLF